MSGCIPFNRDRTLSVVPALRAWLPDDDLMNFIVAAVERVPIEAFRTGSHSGGKPLFHSRLMLALLIYSYANGIFLSRLIDRATYRDIAVRFVAANPHPDHDTITVFRTTNRAAFLQILLRARKTDLLRLGTLSIHGTKIDANASKIRSARYDQACELRAKLAADIADLTAQAKTADTETADTESHDPQALPAELARREALKAKLDGACELI